MSNDENIIYGDGNGYLVEIQDHNGKTIREVTHWDSKLVISSHAGTISVGIVPVDHDYSTDEHPVYDADRAQFITISREGSNRAIRALRKARIRVFGQDE